MTAPPNLHTPGWKARYLTIFGGQAVSLIGSAMTQFVLLWWITQETGSVGALAVAGMMALLPQALLGPIGGTVADRISRRAVMIAADAVSAVCVLVLIALFATGAEQLWHVYALLFVRSSMQAFQQPAASASTSMLVPTEWLPRAAGLNQTLAGIMTVAAAPLGALALATLPLAGALAIDVVTAALGITPLLLHRIPQGRREDAASGFRRDLVEGLRFVWAHRGIRALYGLLALVVLTIMPTFSLTPLLVRQHFGGGPAQVALMESLSGVGMILGGVLASVLTLPRRRVLVVLGAFLVSCGTVALTALAPGGALWLAALWWFVSGLTFTLGNAPLTAILQTIVPNHMQGRVLSLLNTVMGLAGPAGLALAAPLGELVGVRGVFVVGGALSALVCLVGFVIPALLRVEDNATPGAPAARPASD